MADLIKLNPRIHAHKIYRLESGLIVPGVTSIIKEWSAGGEFLVKWANNLGLEGIDSNKYRDETADIGKLAHAMIVEKLGSVKVDFSDYSENEIEQAQFAVHRFDNWTKEHKVKTIECEKELVSEKNEYGGTIDLIAMVDNIKESVDFKTGKQLYAKHYVQMAGYDKLLIENDIKVQRWRLLNIPRTNGEKFWEDVIDDEEQMRVFWNMFLSCREMYKIHKQIKNYGI